MSRSSPVPRDADALSRPALAAGRPESAVDMWLGQQLRQLRKQHGRSLADVAQACAMSVGSASAQERDVTIAVSIPAATHGWTGGVVYHAEQAEKEI
ncbi:MAG: helix-turn-helix domain-containing protein, partial [Achromobacter sp.]|nr:helix-turn-helix domain-containing protein [Achromobacter sp.]